MLALKTFIRPIFGFASGTFLGLTSMLYMNDIVYSIFKEKLISPVYKQYGKNQQLSTDSVKNISYVTAKGSIDAFTQVKPHAMNRSNVKKIFIDDKDYSQPQDHYFSFIRRRKQAKLDEIQQNYIQENQQWSQKHNKEDYKKLSSSKIHQVFGQSLNFDGRKDLDAIGERYIQLQRKQEDLDLIAQKSKRLQSDKKEDQSDLLTPYINPQNEQNLAMNSGLFKFQKTPEKTQKQPRQISPQKIQHIIAQKNAEEKKLSREGKKIQQIGSIPSFTEGMLKDFMRNPNQIKEQNEIIRNQRKEYSPMNKPQKVKSPPARTNAQFKPRAGDLSSDLRQINFEDKKRLLKLASKARDID